MSGPIAAVSPAYADSYVAAVDPLVAYMDGVLNERECEHIIKLARGQMQRAVVSFADKPEVSAGRTGSNTWVRHDTDEVVHTVARRIARIIGIPLENAESLQVIHYGAEQQYKPHYDAYDLKSPTGQRCCRRGGQRLVTALVYLNDVERGGATTFPNKQVEVAAKRGRMAIFHNTLVGSVIKHPDSLHAGTPVEAGEKWAFNVWFRARPMSELQDFSQHMDAVVEKGEAVSAAKPVEKLQLTVKSNRASQLFREAFGSLKAVMETSAVARCFTYWDTFYSASPDMSDVPDNAIIYKMISRDVLNGLSNKKAFAQKVQASKLVALAPPTYWNIEEARAYTGTPVELWFIKDVFSTGGKNMQCITNEQLQTFELKANYIVQAAVPDLALVDGRKFTVRIYILVWMGGIYLYPDGCFIVHAVKYVEGSTDYIVQIDHKGYADKDSAVQMLPLSEHPEKDAYWPAIRQLVGEAKPILQQCIAASSSTDYIILGVDLMLQSHGGVQMIEINTSPNFIHTQKVNSEVNVPMIASAMAVVSGSGEGDFEKL